MEQCNIFISYSKPDDPLAQAIKNELNKCLLSCKVFTFSTDITPGNRWFEGVLDELKNADVLIILVTPHSIQASHWVWFELGYFWSKHNPEQNKEKLCLPLCLDGVARPTLIADLQVQMTSLNDDSKLEDFFKVLKNKFGESKNHVNLKGIKDAVQNLSTVINSKHHSEIPQTSPYEGYSDDELVLRMAQLIEDNVEHYYNADYDMYLVTSPSILTSKPVNFEDFDKEYQLPLGTSRRLLEQVMLKHFNRIVEFRGDNIIKFIEQPKNPPESPPQYKGDIPF